MRFLALFCLTVLILPHMARAEDGAGAIPDKNKVSAQINGVTSKYSESLRSLSEDQKQELVQIGKDFETTLAPADEVVTNGTLLGECQKASLLKEEDLTHFEKYYNDQVDADRAVKDKFRKEKISKISYIDRNLLQKYLTLNNVKHMLSVDQAEKDRIKGMGKSALPGKCNKLAAYLTTYYKDSLDKASEGKGGMLHR